MASPILLLHDPCISWFFSWLFPRVSRLFPWRWRVFYGFFSPQVCPICRVGQQNEHPHSLLENLAEELCCGNLTTTNCKVETILPTPWFLASSRSKGKKLSGRCSCGLALTSKALNCDRVLKNWHSWPSWWFLMKLDPIMHNYVNKKISLKSEDRVN